MALAAGDHLGDGWVLERTSSDGLRFVRPPTIDRRRAGSRLVVMGGCLAVTLALLGVSTQSAEALWLITWSLIALFGATSVLALLAAVKDLRRAHLGVFLDIDASEVKGVLDGQGVAGQFQVKQIALPRSRVTLTLAPFEGGSGAGMLSVTSAEGRLLAPDFPNLADARALLAKVGA